MATSPTKGDVPILIYASGLGQYEANTAGGVADVIATVLDRHRSGTYRSSTEVKVTAPRGLRVGKPSSTAMTRQSCTSSSSTTKRA
jgi:hypothetical protein